MKNRDLYLLILLTLCIDLIVVALHLYFSQHNHLGTLFDLDKEANFPTWYTSFKLTLAGVVALLIYEKEKIDSDKTLAVAYTKIWFWLLIALLMFFMSADETAQIHETITKWFMQTLAGARLLHSLEIGKTGATLVWGLVFSPILVLVAGSLLHFYLGRFKQRYILIILTILMLCLFLGSFLLEHQEAHLAGQLNQITLVQLQRYEWMTLIEESCELFATSLLLLIHFAYYKLNENAQ